jgi:hypothetical protein
LRFETARVGSRGPKFLVGMELASIRLGKHDSARDGVLGELDEGQPHPY